MNLKFSGRGLAFLSHYMATNDIRYYLNGIFLTPMPDGVGVLGAATNGHCLGMWRDEKGHIDRPAILRVSRPLITALKKPETFIENRDGRLTAMQYLPHKQGIGDELYIQPNEGGRPSSAEAWEVEGVFPPNIHTIPPSTDGPFSEFVDAISAEYMGMVSRSILEALKKSSRGKFAGVWNRQKVNGALMFLSPQLPEAAAFVMPMRAEGEKFGSPWLDSWRRRATVRANAKETKLPGQQPSDAVPPPDFQRSSTTGRYPA